LGIARKRVICFRNHFIISARSKFKGSSSVPVALVTGAAIRLGRSIALRLAQEGFVIAAQYNTSRDEAESLREEITGDNGRCSLFEVDLAVPDIVSPFFRDVTEQCGMPNLIVNNAAMFVNDDASDFSLDQFDRHVNVNLKAPIVLSKEFFNGCDDREDRLIVNMLDNKVYALNPDFFSYTVSKCALRDSTEMLAMRFAPKVRVCGIAPSVTLISGKQTQKNFEKSRELTPLKRGPSPEEIAEAVVFMWRTKSYNGDIMTLDGGQSLLKFPRDVAFLVKEDLI